MYTRKNTINACRFIKMFYNLHIMFTYSENININQCCVRLLPLLLGRKN